MRASDGVRNFSNAERLATRRFALARDVDFRNPAMLSFHAPRTQATIWRGDIAFSTTARRKVLRQDECTNGNAAVVWQETETEGTFKGKAVHVMGTETAVLEKVGDKWTYAKANEDGDHAMWRHVLARSYVAFRLTH